MRAKTVRKAKESGYRRGPQIGGWDERAKDRTAEEAWSRRSAGLLMPNNAAARCPAVSLQAFVLFKPIPIVLTV